MYFRSETGIFRANFNGYDNENIYNNYKGVIQIFAFDWIGRRMYIVKTDSAKVIFGADMKFVNRIELHSSAEDILSLAVDPYVG